MALPTLDGCLGTARAFTRDDCLVVRTGRMERAWRWTAGGLATATVRDLVSGRCWRQEPAGCDWQLPAGTEPDGADLRSLTAAPGTDEGFTGEHLCVSAEIAYPRQRLVVRLSIWAYPEAPGLRTALAVRRTGDLEPPSARTQGAPCPARVDRVPGDPECARRFFGYYNETQQRNDTHQDLLQEEVVSHPLRGREWCDWASVACVEDAAGGLALVKESHKCVNQRGHDTGGFVVDSDTGLACTGWGVRPEEIGTAYTPGWATWCIVWGGGDVARQTALKSFDRCRYPQDPARDIYIQANTWGSTATTADARRAATEAPVLQDLEACAEMGIDVLQVDDGWQVPPGHHSWDPGDRGWYPHPESWPHGWATLRERAAELGIRLGLWAPATTISLDELRANRDAGGFGQFKLDFAHLRSRAEIDALMAKVRAFIAATGHAVRVNWDVTENAARYGYFFAREYGCIYLENRKPVRPLSVVYRPHTVLRDLWQVARYLDLHRFQGTIQNIDMVDRAYSDAADHSHGYAVAVALMSTPLFFVETKYYSAAAKAEIGALLAVYKEHRAAIYRGLVYPLGSRPDNASWTGFQCHLADEQRGYLTVFRERCSGAAQRRLQLVDVPSGELELTDLLRGTTVTVPVDRDGVDFSMPTAPDFRFYAYTLRDQAGQRHPR